MARSEQSRPRGPKSVFRPKSMPPACVTLTPLGKRILQAASERTGQSRSDIVELLLRKYGSSVEFEEFEAAIAVM